MNIFVCVKQVPDTTIIKIDPVTNTLIRTGVSSILNPFDAEALETALRIKDQRDAKVYVISMGPNQAIAILRESLALGADGAYLVSDRVFGGSDTLATSYILSSAIKAVEEKVGKADLILTGKQAIDGDTGQVGPEISEHLGIPQITYVCGVKELAGNKAVICREAEDAVDILEVQTPAVLSVSAIEGSLRYPTIISIDESYDKEITVLSSANMTVDNARIGLTGSPTNVKKSYTPEVNTTTLVIDGNTNDEKVDKLVGYLKKDKVM